MRHAFRYWLKRQSEHAVERAFTSQSVQKNAAMVCVTYKELDDTRLQSEYMFYLEEAAIYLLVGMKLAAEMVRRGLR